MNHRYLNTGSDIGGLTDHLDYLVDLGIKGIYIAGTPYINKPWDYHSYNALDFTILDPHLGSVAEWRAAIQAAHDRGIYVLLDLTIATLGDLLGFEGHINQTAPFNLDGYNVVYKNDKKYVDFTVRNGSLSTNKWARHSRY